MENRKGPWGEFKKIPNILRLKTRIKASFNYYINYFLVFKSWIKEMSIAISFSVQKYTVCIN